jgi:hypothetical protein
VFRVQCSGLRVPGPRFRVQGSMFQGAGCRVQGLGFWVQGSRFSVERPSFKFQGPGFRFLGPVFTVDNSRFRIQGPGFRIQASGLGVRVLRSRVQVSGFRLDGSGFSVLKSRFKGLNIYARRKRGGHFRAQPRHLLPVKAKFMRCSKHWEFRWCSKHHVVLCEFVAPNIFCGARCKPCPFQSAVMHLSAPVSQGTATSNSGLLPSSRMHQLECSQSHA